MRPERGILPLCVLPLALTCTVGCRPEPQSARLQFGIAFAASASSEPLNGRILLILSREEQPEPRFQVGAGLDAPQIFGVDVEDLAPGEQAVIDSETFGFPLERLVALQPDDYVIQAILHRYEDFQLKNGKSVKLPMDRGEGQRWNRAPGNLYSVPRKLRIDPGEAKRLSLVLDQVVPPVTPPEDTKYVKHVKIQSQLLTEFWGRPMHLGAHVLLPEGFEERPQERYPLAVFHGHFPADFRGFRSESPDPDLECEYSERFRVECYNRVVQQEAYEFYKRWTSTDFPRLLIVEIQHANPYYDDSYAVNSANLGPYGDAITYELIPYIEEQFRGIGDGWARFLYGGSTGGWEALAAQVFYPDEYNGAFAACPDPIDFRAYMLVNIYEDENAYYRQGQFKRIERPAHRDWLGRVDITLRDYNHMELVLGENSRSGDQFDIWQAVYSPMGDDGYPKPIWDKYSGAIDSEVAAYWRENYDLRYVLQRDWKKLGPKLRGKIHIYVGDMDNYYLNNAVYLMEEFLESTTDPYYAGEIDYGDGAEHCWNGDQENPNHVSRLRYNTMYLPKILHRLRETAPPGVNRTGWRD